MKILQVNSVYKKGSTGKVMFDIHTELLRRNYESIVCYGRGENIHEELVYKTCGELYSKVNQLVTRITGVMYGGCFCSTRKLISIIKSENPDIVHLQCINGYFVNIYQLLEWLKNNHIKTVITLHAEFMYTGGCGHALDCNQWKSESGCGASKSCPRWKTETKSLFFDRTNVMWKKMKESFEGFDNNLIITSVSPWLMHRAKVSPILCNKQHRIVYNGLDTEIFHYCDASDLRNELGLKEGKIIFHATPNFNLNKSHLKGGYYVNEIAKRLLGKNVKIIVAGPYMDGIEVAENIVLLGRVTDQLKLAMLYSLADLTLLTSHKETFSMVTAESLSCGTPVVGFKAGGPEQIALKDFSKFVDYSDLNSLYLEIENFLTIDFDSIKISNLAKATYAKETMCEKYIDIYKELLNLV